MTETATAAACPVCGAAAVVETGFGDAPLRRCTVCRFMFLDPDAQAAGDLYGDAYFADYADGDYRAQEEQRRHEGRVRLDWMAAWAPPPGRLLEAGAASGFFLDEARQRGYEVAGVEISPAMAAHARDALGLDVQAARVDDAVLPDADLDAVCAFHVVEHLPDPLTDVRRLGAALAPGGHLFVEVPNAESALARRAGADWPALDLPYHVGHHGPRSMRKLLERAGLDPVALDTVPFALYGHHRMQRTATVGRVALESVRARKPLPPGPHPSRHQVLRAVARRPGG